MGAPTADVLALLEATFDAVVIMDDRGRITAFNRAAEEMFGYRAADALGRNVSMLMTAPDRAEHDEHLRRYLTTGAARVLGKGRDVRVRHRDGSEFSVDVGLSRLPALGGRGVCVCASVRGLPIEPCFNLQQINEHSFRGAISGLGFAYCEFTRRGGDKRINVAHGNKPVSLKPTTTADAD